MKYDRVIQGTFIDRPNRFIANVRIKGEGDVPDPVVRCHVKNTGRCRELLVPGARVYLDRPDSPGRSTLYDLVTVDKGGMLVNMDSQAPNEIAFESLERIIGPYDTARREYAVGNSRFDIYAVQGGREVLVEVKGVTLERDGDVYFPDAPTERGRKHLRELQHLAKCSDYRCAVCFVVQMECGGRFHPNTDTDPDFGDALNEAHEAGVEILAFSCNVTPEEVVLGEEIESLPG